MMWRVQAEDGNASPNTHAYSSIVTRPPAPSLVGASSTPPDNRTMLETEGPAVVDHFFTEGDENLLLEPTISTEDSDVVRLAQVHGRPPPTAHSSTLSLSRKLTNISIMSRDTFIDKDPDSGFGLPRRERGRSLVELLEVIRRHRSLQDARIVCAEAYKLFNGRVVHRFIILELERDGRQQIWLRIERGREEGQSVLNFLARRATARADDQVSLYIQLYAYTIGLKECRHGYRQTKAFCSRDWSLNTLYVLIVYHQLWVFSDGCSRQLCKYLTATSYSGYVVQERCYILSLAVLYRY